MPTCTRRLQLLSLYKHPAEAESEPVTGDTPQTGTDQSAGPRSVAIGSDYLLDQNL